MEGRDDFFGLLRMDVESCPLFQDTDAAECEHCPLLMFCMDRREEVEDESR